MVEGLMTMKDRSMMMFILLIGILLYASNLILNEELFCSYILIGLGILLFFNNVKDWKLTEAEQKKQFPKYCRSCGVKIK